MAINNISRPEATHDLSIPCCYVQCTWPGHQWAHRPALVVTKMETVRSTSTQPDYYYNAILCVVIPAFDLIHQKFTHFTPRTFVFHSSIVNLEFGPFLRVHPLSWKDEDGDGIAGETFGTLQVFTSVSKQLFEDVCGLWDSNKLNKAEIGVVAWLMQREIRLSTTISNDKTTLKLV